MQAIQQNEPRPNVVLAPEQFDALLARAQAPAQRDRTWTDTLADGTKALGTAAIGAAAMQGTRMAIGALTGVHVPALSVPKCQGACHGGTGVCTMARAAVTSGTVGNLPPPARKPAPTPAPLPAHIEPPAHDARLGMIGPFAPLLGAAGVLPGPAPAPVGNANMVEAIDARHMNQIGEGPRPFQVDAMEAAQTGALIVAGEQVGEVIGAAVGAFVAGPGGAILGKFLGGVVGGAVGYGAAQQFHERF